MSAVELIDGSIDELVVVRVRLRLVWVRRCGRRVRGLVQRPGAER